MISSKRDTAISVPFTCCKTGCYFSNRPLIKLLETKSMSFSEILEEIPKMTLVERRELFLQVLSLEPEEEDLAICDHAASEGFAMLDLMEAKQGQ
jgi:hypothetical protein